MEAFKQPQGIKLYSVYNNNKWTDQYVAAYHVAYINAQ